MLRSATEECFSVVPMKATECWTSLQVAARHGVHDVTDSWKNSAARSTSVCITSSMWLLHMWSNWSVCGGIAQGFLIGDVRACASNLGSIHSSSTLALPSQLESLLLPTNATLSWGQVDSKNYAKKPFGFSAFAISITTLWPYSPLKFVSFEHTATTQRFQTSKPCAFNKALMTYFAGCRLGKQLLCVSADELQEWQFLLPFWCL